MLEFPNTLESKLNIEITSPSSDVRKPSDGELGRKWLYLKEKFMLFTTYYIPVQKKTIMHQKIVNRRLK